MSWKVGSIIFLVICFELTWLAHCSIGWKMAAMVTFGAFAQQLYSKGHARD